MALKKEDKDFHGKQRWVQYVPLKYAPGLQMWIVANSSGLKIGGDVIPWHELIDAMECAIANKDNGKDVIYE